MFDRVANKETRYKLCCFLTYTDAEGNAIDQLYQADKVEFAEKLASDESFRFEVADSLKRYIHTTLL